MCTHAQMRPRLKTLWEAQLRGLISDTSGSTWRLMWSFNTISQTVVSHTYIMHTYAWCRDKHTNVTHISSDAHKWHFQEDFLLLMRPHALYIYWGGGQRRSSWLSILLPIALFFLFFFYPMSAFCMCSCRCACVCVCVYQGTHTHSEKATMARQTQT